MGEPLFIDLETSGLEVPPAVILQIGAVYKDKTFNQLVIPNHVDWAFASPKALEVNGLTLEKLHAGGVKPEQAFSAFINWLLEHDITAKTAFYVGQNPGFDQKFLSYFMGEVLAFVDFPTITVDVRELYTEALQRKVLTTNGSNYRSGENISRALGLPPETYPHDALAGARAAAQNYFALMKLLGA